MSSPSSAPGFAALGVPAPIVAALQAIGIAEPFPIQRATLPDALAGRDLLGRGKTGSGKTLGFAIPIVARLAAEPQRPRPGTPRAMILVPTRELANQVAATIAPLAKACRLSYTTIYGGVGFGNQIDALRNGVDIIVACPGRLDDLIKQRHCRLDRVEITVLDEADHMTDMGFLPVVRRLLDHTPRDGQRLLFSATLDRDVQVIVDRYLSNPVTHAVDPEDSPVEAMTHHLLETAQTDKLGVVTRLASGHDRTLLFTRTKHGAKKLVRQLGQGGVAAVELHGNLSQAARERNLASFADGSAKVLVATDIAARGIHVDDIRLVVHVDPPAEHKAFLHRSGRTARAGAAGVVVTISTPEQRKDVRELTRAAGISPLVTRDVTSRAGVLADLAGPTAPPSARPAHVRTDVHRPDGHRSDGHRSDGHRSAPSSAGAGRNGSSRHTGDSRGPSPRPAGARSGAPRPSDAAGRPRRRRRSPRG